jgi:coatomer subunit beta'
MDTSGKIIFARHNSIHTVNVKTATQITDGERLALVPKELGNCEVYPQNLAHAPNGRMVSVCGDGEFIVYTALAWRNKSFGNAAEFVWGADSNLAAAREGSRIRILRDFAERSAFSPPFTPDGIFGGALLGVRCGVKDEECIFFYDWENLRVVRRIDVAVKNVFWSDSGEFVAIASESSFYILRFNKEKVDEYIQAGVQVSWEEGGLPVHFICCIDHGIE